MSSLVQMIDRKARALHGVSVESSHSRARVEVFIIVDFPSQKKDEQKVQGGFWSCEGLACLVFLANFENRYIRTTNGSTAACEWERFEEL